jgi:hypothetical protein
MVVVLKAVPLTVAVAWPLQLPDELEIVVQTTAICAASAALVVEPRMFAVMRPGLHPVSARTSADTPAALKSRFGRRNQERVCMLVSFPTWSIYG